MTLIHEDEVPETRQPGRYMRWLTDAAPLSSDLMSVCIIRVLPGESVHPAHSHPKSEEMIYIVAGSGKVMIENEVAEVKTGTAVLFQEGKIHMLKNTGDIEMKVICFFAPATSLDNYKTFEDISFPE